MTAPAPQLELANITKMFPNVRALDGVSIDVRPGEILALMGENGAGKSTLLKVMTGAYQLDGGEIRLGGTPVQISSPIASRRLGIRVAYQEPDIVGGVTVAENLFLGELPRRSGRLVDWRRLNEDTEALLAPFRLGRTLHPATLAERLSPAQRQMIEILRALAGGSEGARARRADLVALELGHRGSLCADRAAEGPRRRPHLRLAPDAGNPPPRRPGVGAARRSVGRDASRGGAGRLDADPDDGRPPARRGDQAQVARHARHGAEGVGTDAPTKSPTSTSACRKGEVVGLAGLIGAGRTELGKTVFGAFGHDRGTIEVEGRQVTIRRPQDAIDAGIAYTPEERKADGLFPERSVSENATLAILRQLTRFRVVQRPRELAIAGDYVRRLRVKTPSLAQPIGKLSGGNQQKVVLARWLATKPKVLILDEPTRGIDVGAKAEIYALIETLAREGMGILLISSELPEILRLSDRIVCMQNGMITGELTAEEADEERVLQLCMARDLSPAIAGQERGRLN